jgi:tetratricopeptide (TPR) repeat protein
LAGTATVLTIQTWANKELQAANARTLQERDLARQNFDLARRAVDDYLSRVGQNPLLKEQGLHELRQELLEAALRYYREFVKERSGDPSLRFETAAAYQRLGDILIELGQFGGAVDAFDQGLALIEPLIHERPRDLSAAIARIRLLGGRVQALRDRGSHQEAIAAFNQARTLGEELLASSEASGDLTEILARIHLNAALIFKLAGATDDALKVVLRSHALAEQDTRARPNDVSAARSLLEIAVQAGQLLRRTGHPVEAHRLCEEQIAFGNERLRDHPRDVELRMNLAYLAGLLAELERDEGRQLEALRLMTSTTVSLDALARENPQLFRVRAYLANALFSRSSIESDLDRLAEADKHARASIELFEALARDVPSSPEFRVKAGWGYAILGKVLEKKRSYGEALAMFRKAAAAQADSDDALNLYNLACCFALASSVADPREGPAGAGRQRADAERAVVTLRRAVAKGFASLTMLRNDPDFDSLRGRDDFQRLLMDLLMPADPFARRQ